jgi:hypothetical protein
MSGLFGSVTIKGTRITDFAQSTATVGIVIPFGRGTFPVDGNVIFAPMPPKEHVTKKRQGKGGVKQEVFTYTLSYAIAFCKGPVYGYLWIKRNGKVVYTEDPNAPLEDINYAAKWALKTTFYYGTKDQLPDSTIESYKGTGLVSAFRNLAYIVVEDDDVTDGGGAVPTYEACVVASPPEVYVTSKPYSLLASENLSSEIRLLDGKTIESFSDNMQISFQADNGLLREVIQKYYPVESLSVVDFSLQDGLLKTVLVSFSQPFESLELTSFSVQDGTLLETLKRYQNYQPELLDIGFSLQSGTLT